MNDFQNKYPSEHLLKIIQSSHDAFIVSDHDMKIVYSNKTAQNIFGYTEKEMEGLSILELMPEDRRKNYANDIESALKGEIITNVNTDIDLFGQRKNGKAFPIELTYTYYIFDNKNYFVSQIRDISEKKDREKELNTLTTALRVLTEVNRLIVDSNDEAEYLANICNAITDIGKFPRSAASLIKNAAGGDKLICNLAFSGYKALCPPEKMLLSEAHLESLTAIVINEKRTEVCNDIIGRNLWKYWVDDPSKIEFESTIAVPIIMKNSVEGILRVFSKDPFYFTEEKVLLLEDLAKDISRGITVLRERKELETTTLALNVITEANRILTGARNEQQYLNDICKIIADTGGFVRAAIYTVENIKNEDKIVSVGGCVGFEENERNKLETFILSKIKNSGSPTIIALREKKVNICENISARGLWKYWVDKPEKLDFESTVAVPVISNDDIIALIRIYSKEPFYFTEEKLKLLEELSKDIAHGLSYIRAKAENINSENKYRTLFENSSDGVYLADAETGIIFDANTKAADLIGLPAERLIGLKYREIHPSGAGNVYDNVIEDLLINGRDSSSGEAFIRSLSAKGKAIPVQISANIFYLNGKKIIQNIFRDISRFKAQEENLRTVQKMEALGTLSGGIAHDINNILSPVIGFTQLAILEFEDKEKQNNYLNEVLTAANRAKELVSQILTFCRKSETDKKQHKIQNIMREVIKLISISLPPNVELHTVIDDSCEPILCDPVQIYQVVINLCTNAYQAMKDTGGVLKVCLVRKGSPEIKIESSEKLPFENYICLIVSDTGCGMTKTTFNRIFEPYFTTKPKEEGTGLGLSVVSGIVKEHGGEIYVRTYPKEGTYFKISFPTVSFFAENKKFDYGIPSESKSLNILVVDDELQITFMLKHMLGELGYSSETYNDSESAYNAFKNDPLKYDMVITDQTMPKLLGTELSRKILEIRPDMPIILNTGYSPVASKSEAKKIGIKEFMMKPITISELSVAIDNALKKSEISN